MSDKVTRLPVIGRPRDKALEIVYYDPQQPCIHRNCSYRVREGEADVECGGCGKRLDPMFVILQLAQADSMYNHRAIAAAKIAREMEERSRTKCQHCGRMTRIHV